MRLKREGAHAEEKGPAGVFVLGQLKPRGALGSPGRPWGRPVASNIWELVRHNRTSTGRHGDRSHLNGLRNVEDLAASSGGFADRGQAKDEKKQQEETVRMINFR